MRLVLMLSPDAYRGFSGEGAVLGDLAAGPAAEDAAELLFHRPLPWSEGAAEAANPRLRGARALVAAGAVRLAGAGQADGALARGQGADAHLVRADGTGQLSCTCAWWARYRGGRGPCRHVLAVRMVRDQETEETR